MSSFWNLIRNENMKIYRRLRTWVMFAFTVFVPLATSLLLYLADGKEGTLDSWSVTFIEGEILFLLINIFTVVKAAESVAGEFSWGTIKLLLIRPWSRSSILLSKYISIFLFALLMAIVAFAVSMAVNIPMFGTIDLPKALEYYGLHLIGLVFVAAFAFMLSSAFRSNGLAIGLSIFLLMASVTRLFDVLFGMTDKPWVKYVGFLHLNLVNYLEGGAGPIPNQETTLGFSIAVLAAYVIVFNIVSWTVFRKRDVAA
ncbi:ABC transporter permease subunit [Cohnella sp. CFH 77786]|uniref:ABC transporter permease n=1 Tax=Cohnella sp. CFH 77786 TaxID=2662265 RepID=UPI001C60AD26|nr:DUF2705 family protein [Cohnella sp. CFH 77786]MBW5448393.1 ABC transporter permease subunit [Cohnella sp. CFH 77786]